jgi:hypothetical protein
MLFVTVWAVAAVHAPAAAPPPFVSAAFDNPPEPSVLEIRGPLATNVASILGYVYPHPHVNYWRTGGKTVWILEGRGRSSRFTAGFVLDGGRIAASEVLDYRGDRGREIRSRSFLRQFVGAGLRENRKLDRKIDGITGATISVNAVENLARLALYLDSHASGSPGPAGTGKAQGISHRILLHLNHFDGFIDQSSQGLVALAGFGESAHRHGHGSIVHPSGLPP